MSHPVSDCAVSPAQTGSADFIGQHLNVQWLRPESALWDAIASSLVAQIPFEPPSLDLGCGNGIFSFITAGGSFSPEYDGYRNVDLEGFWENRDVYDCFRTPMDPAWIIKRPRYQLDWALDAKGHLLSQAKALAFYRHRVLWDANRRLPFREESFQTVFSNMLSWLTDLEFSLREIARVLRLGGRAWLCLPDHRFRDYCVSYRWKESNSRILQLLNRGRGETLRWTISASELEKLTRRVGLKLVSDTPYLSPRTLTLWDVGLRPLFPVLVRMVEKLPGADRRSMKSEWIGTITPFLEGLIELEGKDPGPKGYHLISLEREPCH